MGLPLSLISIYVWIFNSP